MKILCGIIALATASVALANNIASFPKDKVTKYVVENLNVTTLPSGLRPKRDHDKKTFSDYGYVTSSLDENQAIVATPAGTQINIKILELKSSEIYVCVAGTGENPTDKIQRVFLLKLKNSGNLLKGRESWKEFDACLLWAGRTMIRRPTHTATKAFRVRPRHTCREIRITHTAARAGIVL